MQGDLLPGIPTPKLRTDYLEYKRYVVPLEVNCVTEWDRLADRAKNPRPGQGVCPMGLSPHNSHDTLMVPPVKAESMSSPEVFRRGGSNWLAFK